MRTKIIAVSAVSGIAALSVAASILGLPLLFTSRCKDQEVSEAASPDNRHIATVFTRNCGATTGFTTHVTVRPQGTKLDEDSPNLLMLEGRPTVRIKWNKANVLQIERPPERKLILEQIIIWGDLDIIYVDSREK